MTESMKVFKAGEQSADDPLEFVMSTNSVDRMGDVIDQSGWDLKSFTKNPVALWGHNSSYPIGVWENVRVEGTRTQKLIGRLKLAKSGTSRFIDELRSLIEQRILRAVSVGFMPKEYEPIRDADGRTTGYKFLKADLMECSLVSVPANQDALSLAKSLSISDDTLISAFAASGVSMADFTDFRPNIKEVEPFRLRGKSAERAKTALALATRSLKGLPK
jgi:HK97 family phage prohead protease